jgi:hypothetical protein
MQCNSWFAVSCEFDVLEVTLRIFALRSTAREHVAKVCAQMVDGASYFKECM